MRTGLTLRMRIFFFLLCAIISSAFLLAEKKAPQKSDLYARPAPPLIEQSLINLINEEREKQGLPGLRLSPGLTSLARKHSRDMADRDKLSHPSSAGESYLDRLVGGGFFFGRMGENVVRSETFDSRWIHQSLMDSPEHRENILDPLLMKWELGLLIRARPVVLSPRILSRAWKLRPSKKPEKPSSLKFGLSAGHTSSP